MMEKTAQRWHIEFDIVDYPDPDPDLGFVASYYRKEAIDGIKKLFSDFSVEKLRVRRADQ